MTINTSKEGRTLNESKLREKIRWEPHKNQDKILKAFDGLKNSREILIRAGRRFGKSEIAAYIALREILRPNRVVWVVSPNYGLSEIIFNNVAGWIGNVLTPGKSYSVSKNPVNKIEVMNGSILEVKSAENPQSLLGRSTDLVILDEAAQLKEYLWERYIYPTTYERQGKIVYISTPQGKNWFYEKELELNQSFHFTTKDNPHLPKDEWEKTKRKMTSAHFRQEHMAEYISDANAVFTNVESVIRTNIDPKPVDNGMYIIGVDIGRRSDASAIVVLERNTHKVVFVEELKGADYSLQKAHIIALAQRYNNASILIESTGSADAVYQDLMRSQARVEEFRTAGHNKAQLIEKLALFIDQQALILPDHKQLIQEMRDYEMIATETGFNKYKGRGKKPDDLVIALALAVWQLPGIHMTEEEKGRDLDKFRRVPNKILNDYE